MSAEETLRSNERAALNGERIISNVGNKSKKKAGGVKKFSAAAFVAIAILIFMFSSGSLVPEIFSERLIEQTDIQHADGVESKMAVFQQALIDGNNDSDNNIPSNTVRRLAENGVLVGKLVDGKFIEGTDGSNLVLYMDGQIITAENFMNTANTNGQLYDAFNKATYSAAAYHYDDTAMEVFKKIGTNRNNYSSNEDFETTTSKLLGEGNNIDVNNVILVKKQNDKGETYYKYETLGEEAKAEAADNFIAAVSKKNKAASEELATLNAADTLNVADTIAKEQKSSLLFLAFMENISKMKVGEGNESKINEVMNYLYKDTVSEVVDVKTGETIAVRGSMMESPSLYAILSGEKVDAAATENYSSDRILKTLENKTGTEAKNETLLGTITSVAGKIQGSIGRFLNGNRDASTETLSTVAPTVKNSLIDNNFENIGGISGGELLAEGAVNVGKALARAGGATAGDNTAVKAYAKLTNTVLALDAESDRMNRSPFDITSKNTFLGSIVHKMAVGIKTSTLLKTMGGMIRSIFPAAYADDENNSYLTNFGDCRTLGAIGAVGSVTCATVATFDTSTLNNIFNDPNFKAFVEANTELKDGRRQIKNDSDLANFIKYNNERLTPDGVMDGGILTALKSSSNITFLGDILSMVETFLGANNNEKRIASGAAFVNSESNPDWNTYKYAQRYVSLARAAEALRKYDGEPTAYSNLKYFEGAENPVVAFLNDYHSIANK